MAQSLKDIYNIRIEISYQILGIYLIKPSGNLMNSHFPLVTIRTGQNFISKLLQVENWVLK